jgi:BCD family chlorophyll transporter-like MFS transporter
MSAAGTRATRFWKKIGIGALPFADAASPELPLSRLLRLALLQVSVGIVVVLLNGTLNRVMIVELGIPAWIVATTIAMPVLFAPLRALIGHRSDHYRSEIGWRRVPFIWMGTMIQFGGLAILPFALLVLSGRGELVVPFAGELAVGAAFLSIGAGLHTSQTAAIALATDLAPEETRPRVVALLYVMLLVGMVGASLIFGGLLQSFSYTGLVQVIQGAALTVLCLNVVALWKQESRTRREPGEPEAPFTTTMRTLLADRDTRRLLVAVALGGAGFSMQDILLEPYGGEMLSLSVSATTVLTALMAGGTLLGLYVASRKLALGTDPYKLAALGALAGIAGVSVVVFAGPLGSIHLFWLGTVAIGFGNGWFGVGTLTASMSVSDGRSGLVIGAWGAVQATAAGSGLVLGGILRDVISSLATRGALGPGLTSPSIGYSFVYHLEIAFLFATLVAIGPLVRAGARERSMRLGLADLPS